MQKMYIRSIGKSGYIIKLMMLVFGMTLSIVSMSQTAGDFRTAASGTWTTSTTWQRYNGTTWNPSGVGANNPGQVPSAVANVFIQSTHTVTLIDELAARYAVGGVRSQGGGSRKGSTHGVSGRQQINGKRPRVLMRAFGLRGYRQLRIGLEAAAGTRGSQPERRAPFASHFRASRSRSRC